MFCLLFRITLKLSPNLWISALFIVDWKTIYTTTQRLLSEMCVWSSPIRELTTHCQDHGYAYFLWVCFWCTHWNTCFFCCQWWSAPLNTSKLTMSRSHWKIGLPTLRDTSNWVGLASHPGLQLYLSPLHVLEIRDTHCPEGATSRLALPQSELSGNSVVLFLSTLRPQPELPELTGQ